MLVPLFSRNEVGDLGPLLAREAVMQLKEQFDSLSPEDQQEAIARLGEIRDKVAGLPEPSRGWRPQRPSRRPKSVLPSTSPSLRSLTRTVS
jgi:hypothetical protein